MIKWRIKSLDQVLIDMLEDEWLRQARVDAKDDFRDDDDDEPHYWAIDVVLDILGVPDDNTGDTHACDDANATGEWPSYGFCRDYWYGFKFDHPERDAEDFIREARQLAKECMSSPHYPKK